jgi:hypothetical protein
MVKREEARTQSAHETQDLPRRANTTSARISNSICAAAWAVLVVASYCVESGAAAQQLHGFAGAQASGFRRPGARSKGRIEAVDIEGHVGRPAAHDLVDLLDGSRDAEADKLLGVQHGHTGVVGEFP